MFSVYFGNQGRLLVPTKLVLPAKAREAVDITMTLT